MSAKTTTGMGPLGAAKQVLCQRSQGQGVGGEDVRSQSFEDYSKVNHHL